MKKSDKKTARTHSKNKNKPEANPEAAKATNTSKNQNLSTQERITKMMSPKEKVKTAANRSKPMKSDYPKLSVKMKQKVQDC